MLTQPQRLQTILPVFAAACLLSAPAWGAVTVISDGFGDGNYNNDATLDGPVENAGDTGTVWYRARGSNTNNSPAVSVVNDAAGIGSGNALDVVANSTSSRFMALNFGDVVLDDVGDYIAVSFDVRITTASTADRAFRFGLYNNGGSAIAADFEGNDSGGMVLHNDFGSFVQMDIGTPATTTADIRWEAAGDAPLGGSSTTFGANTSDVAAALGATAKRVTFKLTLVAVDDMEAVLTVDGVDYITRLTSQGSITPNTDTFNSFVIASQASTDFSYRLDNFELTTHDIPEPAALGLLSLGMLALLRR